MTSWLRRVVPVGAAAAALVAAACGESTSPSGGADPVAVASDVEGVSGAFSAGVGFQSLLALSPRLSLTAPPARAAAFPAAGLGASRDAVLRLVRSLGWRAPAAPEALFPANVLGKTFVWDTSGGGRFHVDSSVTGAPSAGVRFWLYYVPVGGTAPSLPLLPIGNIDLTDQSTPQANTLGVKMLYGDPRLSGGQTLADYALNGVRTTSSYTLSATGYVVDTTGHQVAFNLSNALNTSDSTLRVNDTLSAASGARLWMKIVDSSTTQTHSLQLTDHYQQAGHTVDVIGSSSETAADSTVNVVFKFDGVTWATVTGNESTPTFTNASGQALTLQQELAILQIVIGFFDIFDHANVVFAPAALVF
ncbi:MAG TPA: hypothetical protein VEH83_03190 [Gemmatimonadales bacterium]|nr:hypothetical protein [Gemmatimonadales bacterium]